MPYLEYLHGEGDEPGGDGESCEEAAARSCEGEPGRRAPTTFHLASSCVVPSSSKSLILRSWSGETGGWVVNQHIGDPTDGIFQTVKFSWPVDEDHIVPGEDFCVPGVDTGECLERV